MYTMPSLALTNAKCDHPVGYGYATAMGGCQREGDVGGARRAAAGAGERAEERRGGVARDDRQAGQVAHVRSS